MTPVDPVVVHESALSPNALSPNALSPNALSPGALKPSALSLHALAPSTLGPDALAALGGSGSSGALARSLLDFTVGCAFAPTQSFSLSWTDDQSVVHGATYSGQLGLAPSWATGPLDVVGQRWVSACLAARSNRYGAQVILSVRGDIDVLKPVPASELLSYPHVEGAFWGNLFSATPAVHACFRTENVANSRARLRDCATGKLDDVTGAVQPCPSIAIAGACGSVCTTFDPAGRYYEGCQDPASPPGSPLEVISTSLP